MKRLCVPSSNRVAQCVLHCLLLERMVTSLSRRTPKRIEAKHYRWHAELTQGGSQLLYRAGTSVVHKVCDGLSRNPPRRDELILARIGDWTQLPRPCFRLPESRRGYGVRRARRGHSHGRYS